MSYDQKGGDEDDYKTVIDLTNTVEQVSSPQPQNANQMTDGSGNVVNYNEDPSAISQK